MLLHISKATLFSFIISISNCFHTHLFVLNRIAVHSQILNLTHSCHVLHGKIMKKGMMLLANNIDRILKSVKTTIGLDSYNSIIAACGVLDFNTPPSKQAEYISTIIKRVNETQGEETAKKVMKPCGHQCLSNSVIERAKKLHEKSKDIDDFLQLLNEQQIGGGQLHTRDENIIGVYNTCYCDFPMHTKNMSPVYCYCSAGWFEKLFSSILGDSVNVNILQSILDGSDKCIFEISF